MSNTQTFAEREEIETARRRWLRLNGWTLEKLTADVLPRVAQEMIDADLYSAKTAPIYVRASIMRLLGGVPSTYRPRDSRSGPLRVGNKTLAAARQEARVVYRCVYCHCELAGAVNVLPHEAVCPERRAVKERYERQVRRFRESKKA